jgi:hypothetical protein
MQELRPKKEVTISSSENEAKIFRKISIGKCSILVGCASSELMIANVKINV